MRHSQCVHHSFTSCLHPHHEVQPGFPHGLCSANKQRQSYNCAFKDAALNLGLTIDSTSLMCNFELHHSTFQMLGIGVATTTSCKQSGIMGLLKSTSPTTQLSSTLCRRWRQLHFAPQHLFALLGLECNKKLLKLPRLITLSTTLIALGSMASSSLTN